MKTLKDLNSLIEKNEKNENSDLLTKWKDAGIDAENNKQHLALVKSWLKFQKKIDQHVSRDSKLRDEMDKLLAKANKLGFTGLPDGSGGVTNIDGLEFADLMA